MVIIIYVISIKENYAEVSFCSATWPEGGIRVPSLEFCAPKEYVGTVTRQLKGVVRA